MKKVISFVVPCYHSADYMDRCIESLLAAGDDCEILLVDDGSFADATGEKADLWAANYPNVIRAIHQENKGHGGAINTGLEMAEGLYFKVVDSDDRLDKAALEQMMAYLKEQSVRKTPTDLVIANYVYDHVSDGKKRVINYQNVFPVNTEFTWEDIKAFRTYKFLLMHAAVFRTGLLRKIRLRLPEHCFYVDNLFVYAPLPAVTSLYYINADLYWYYIGREDQSVNEDVMKRQISHHLTVTRHMIDAVRLSQDVPQKHLRNYMCNALTVMMCISRLFLQMIHTEDAYRELADLWNYLKEHDPDTYRLLGKKPVNVFLRLPGKYGRTVMRIGYRFTQKIFKFN